MSEPHTSAFNVEFCLYSMYVGPYIAAIMAGSAGRLYCVLLLPRAPTVLLHSASSKYIQQWDHTGVMPTEGEGKKKTTETQDKRAVALHHVHIATSLVLVPQCSTFTYSKV